MSHLKNNNTNSTGANEQSNAASETQNNRPALTEANLKALQTSIAASTTNNTTASNVSRHQRIPCLVDDQMADPFR